MLAVADITAGRTQNLTEGKNSQFTEGKDFDEIATSVGAAHDSHTKSVAIEPIRNFGRFEVIHDKGTFDLFYMRGDTTLYIDSICQHFVDDQSLVCVTSCNATEVELISAFTSYQASTGIERKFKFECISTLPHTSYTFGGASGQTVSTAAFRATAMQ